MVKQRGIRFNKNGTITEQDFEIQDNIIIDGENRIKFTPNCVFPPAIEKTGGSRVYRKFLFWRWFKKKRSGVFWVDGMLNALNWAEIKEGLQQYWNQKEATIFLQQMVALEALKVKPMKTWQFVILLLMNGLGLILIFRILQMFG